MPDSVPIERQIHTDNSTWFSRRILTCRTHDGAIAAVAITCIDIMERKKAHAALEESQSRDIENAHERQRRAAMQIASLTSRQRQIMELVLAGAASKPLLQSSKAQIPCARPNIAAEFLMCRH